MINTCFLMAQNHLSNPATYFGLKEGNVCVIGYDSSLAAGTIATGGVLSDNYCYQDCGSISASLAFYNTSNLAKCGSQTTSSLYQISNSAKTLKFKTNGKAALGK